jgi:hypothetical protein
MYITTVCTCTQDYCKYKMKPLRYDAIPSRPLPASPVASGTTSLSLRSVPALIAGNPEQRRREGDAVGVLVVPDPTY